MSFYATKDPQAELNFGVKWAEWLAAGDSVTVSEWTYTGPDNALTIVGTDLAASTSEVTLSGGTLGMVYDVVNTVTTTEGLIDERTISLRIVNK